MDMSKYKVSKMFRNGDSTLIELVSHVLESALRLVPLLPLRPNLEVNSESLQLIYFQNPFHCRLVTHVFESELRLIFKAQRSIVSHCNALLTLHRIGD